MATLVTGRVSEEMYRRFALADFDGPLELHDGVLREKPAMSVEHGGVMMDLALALGPQLDRDQYEIRINHAKLRRSEMHYYVPDLAVVPAALVRALRASPGSLDAYSDPLPLVVEIWSPSTGDYDIEEKLPQYMARGDAEIWMLHPFERTLRAHRLRSDGTFAEAVYSGGTVLVESLPGVVVDLDAIFGRA